MKKLSFLFVLFFVFVLQQKSYSETTTPLTAIPTSETTTQLTASLVSGNGYTFTSYSEYASYQWQTFYFNYLGSSGGNTGIAATVVISPAAYISKVKITYGFNVQGLSIRFKSGGNIVYQQPWPTTATEISINQSGIDLIEMYEDGSSNGGGAELYSITTTPAPVSTNNKPTAASFTASSIHQDVAYAFVTANFSYSDTDGDPLDHIRISSVPSQGVLWIDTDGSGTINNSESALSNNGTVSKSYLDAGYLKYLNTNGTSSSFTFEVNDGTDYSTSSYTTTLTVIAIQAPSVSSESASSITATGATLNGLVNANSAATTVTFEYGISDAYGSSLSANQSPLSSSTATAVSRTLSGLSPGVIYHYRIKAVNNGGTTYGEDKTFTTLKNTQTITFDALSEKFYGEADFSPEATASSELTVSYSTSNSSVATILNGKIHITGAGTCTISADQAGNTTYYAASQKTQLLTVSKATPVVSAWPSAEGMIYGETLSVATLSGGSASVDGSFAYTDNTITPESGNYNAALIFTPNDASNYTTVSGSTTVVVAVVTDIKASKSINFTMYPNPTSDYLTLNLKDYSDNVEVSLINVEGKIVYRMMATNDKCTINVGSYPKGLYFVVLSSTTATSQQKLLIE